MSKSICATCANADTHFCSSDGTISCTKYEPKPKTNYERLFGTPERAARTLVRNPMPECGKCILRVECGFNYDSCSMYSQDALLEWLRGDAE